MRFSAYIVLAAAILPVALARPMPQIGGDAQACYGVVNNDDNGSGYAVENAEDNTADLISGQPTGSDSQGSDSGVDSSSGGSSSTTPVRLTRRDIELLRRQLNKISGGLVNLGDALDAQTVTNPVVNDGDVIDSVGTNDQGEIGDQIGDDEDQDIPAAANTATNLDPNGSISGVTSLPGTVTGAAGGAGNPAAGDLPDGLEARK